MSSLSIHSSRPYGALAAAIIIAGVIVASALLVTSGYGTTVTKTSTPTSTLTTAETKTLTIPSSSLASPAISTVTLSTSSTTSTPQQGVSTTCMIAGQPGAMYLRVVSDSNQTPIVGARVAATNEPAYCNDSPATDQTTLSFTTNDSEWYPLDTWNNAGYSIVVVQ
jgi:hypothetical protein